MISDKDHLIVLMINEVPSSWVLLQAHKVELIWVMVTDYGQVLALFQQCALL